MASALCPPFNTIDGLIKLVNRLLDQCNLLLRQEHNQEWLFLCEDFDKDGLSAQQIEKLFIEYGHIFPALNTHLIFNIPIALAYSDKGNSLRLGYSLIYDTPVYWQDHTFFEVGIAALEKLLDARVEPTLFAEGQKRRVLVASGGNLRDLFTIALKAGDHAALRPNHQGKIEAEDVTSAIAERRKFYLDHLGISPNDPITLTYEAKAERLVNIYNLSPGSDVTDPIIHSLFRARAVLEFNGERWFGVHPLVVDILQRHGKLKTTKNRPVIIAGTI